MHPAHQLFVGRDTGQIRCPSTVATGGEPPVSLFQVCARPSPFALPGWQADQIEIKPANQYMAIGWWGRRKLIFFESHEDECIDRSSHPVFYQLLHSVGSVCSCSNDPSHKSEMPRLFLRGP